MSNKLVEELNQIVNERESLFQKIALESGLSELSYKILFIMQSDQEKNWIQSDLSDSFFFSRKSVNSAISKLIDLDLVYLDSNAIIGNKKVIRLTSLGIAFCSKWIDPIIDADNLSFLDMSKEEQEMMIILERKQVDLFKKRLKEINMINFGEKR